MSSLEQALPDGTSISQIYDQASGELLILGGPGSGKTILLLNLAETLQQRATQDKHAPFPVVVNLSTWANTRVPLQDWLIKEFATTYNVPAFPIAQWVQEDQILPLLDGLDEMEESARAACIRAINTYHYQHLGPLVVWSRKDEYETAQRTHLVLHKAVVIQPLTVSQVDNCLAQGWSVRLINRGLGFLLGGLVNLVIGGMLDGIISGLVWALLFLWLFGRDLKIQPKEAVTWSPEMARYGCFLGFGFGVIFKIVFGLVMRAMNPLSFFLTMPAFACMGTLAWGFSEKQLPEQDHHTPNEGIRRSAKIGWMTALLCSISPGVLSGITIGAINGLALGLFGIVVLGQRNGLQTVMRHFLLLFWLWRTHLFPLKAVPFLENATTRVLLRRVGGGYSFPHHLLLEYFADMNVESSPVPTISPASNNFQPAQISSK